MIKKGTGFFWDDPETGSFMDDRYIAFFDALAQCGAALVSSVVGPHAIDLSDGMKGKAREVYAIGDANEPHLIVDAIESGAKIGHEI